MHRALYLVLAVLCFALQGVSAARLLLPHQIADDDTGEAVRLARTCLLGGECPAQGTHTSMLGLRHGASWIRLIGYGFASGGGLSAVQRIVLGLLLGAGLVLAAVVWRFVSPRAAVLALLLSLQPTIGTADFVKLANSNLLPLPLALYYASVAITAAYASLVAGVFGALCVSAAMSFNLTCGLMVPFHLALVGLSARRPYVAVATVGLVLLVAPALESADAARLMAGLLVGTPPVIVAVALVIVAVALAVRPLRGRLVALPLRLRRWRARFAGLPVRLRVRLTMKAAIVYVSLALWTGSLALGSVPGHYLAPLVVPLVFLAVDATESMSSRAVIALAAVGLVALLALPFAPLAFILLNGFILAWSAGVVAMSVVRAIRWRTLPLLGRDRLAPTPALPYVLVAAVLVGSVPDAILFPRDRQSWPVSAAERLATGLYASGYTFVELAVAVQRHSPGTVELMTAMLDPQLSRPPQFVSDPGWSLLPLIVDQAIVARTGGVVFATPITASRTAIAVRLPSYLDRTRLRTCVLADCGDEATGDACVERDPRRPLSHLPPFFTAARVDAGGAGAASSPAHADGRYCVTFSLPVRTPGEGVPHLIHVSEQWFQTTEIVRVTGVAFEGELPGPEIRLLDDREAVGTLEVQVTSEGFGPGADWLSDPPLVEVDTANEHLLKPFRTGRTSRL